MNWIAQYAAVRLVDAVTLAIKWGLLALLVTLAVGQGCRWMPTPTPRVTTAVQP